MKTNQQISIGLLILILILSCMARLYGLDRLSLWADELWVVMESTRGSLWEMLQAVYYHDNHPPGYYLLSRYSQFILGSSDFAIRLPSALAGIALVAATYIAGKKHFSLQAAIIAAALVMGSYQAIYYSQEARPNIFLALFGLLAFHYFRAVILEGDTSQKNYILFGISAAASSYFHYSGLVFCFCLFLIFLVVLSVKHNKTTLMSGMKLFLPLAILYLPWLFGTLQHLVSTPVTAWQRVPDMNTLKTTFWFLFGPDDFRVVFYESVFFVTVLLLLKSKKRLLLGCTLAMIVLPVSVFFIKSYFSQDAYNHRHFLYAIPLMALLAGYWMSAAIDRLPDRFKIKTFVTTVLLIMVYQYLANNSRALYTANHFKQEFRESAQVVALDKDFLKSVDGIIVTNTHFFDHYLKRFTNNSRESDLVFERDDHIAELEQFMLVHHATVFYYLEAPYVPGANGMVTAEDILFSQHYQAVCRTRYARTQAILFSIGKVNAVNWDVLPDCRVISP